MVAEERKVDEDDDEEGEEEEEEDSIGVAADDKGEGTSGLPGTGLPVDFNSLGHRLNLPMYACNISGAS